MNKITIDPWEIESFIDNATIYVSENKVLLISNDNDAILAKLVLEDNSAVVEFTTVTVNVPVSGIKKVQFLT
ncbi:hypothetical protein [Paenibacillus alvei]|uniref:hypothetical protein n=1 Tax=Paenibacillus alvei TaxID=44250 RepID=UPI0013DC6C9E|nr:hypothetical protein [Paenibacillus alvei]NEZ44518.1 hypothetical protein [Paenibacillus alvei]